MEIFQLKDDIRVFCITATSFPQGIMEAFEKLEKLLPTREGRTFFGLSQPGGRGTIIYKAAVQEKYNGEGEQYGCETITIQKGTYLTELITGWQKRIPAIGEIFQQLLADPRLDMNSFCVEWYKNETDVLCMVKLDTTKEN
ncbi:MAG TPA: hypothetical protein VF487_03790 [Chitinophagaceae bacterium]